MRITQESIFVAAIRSFCTSFAAIIGILIGLLVIVFGLMLFSQPNILPEESEFIISEDAEGNRRLLPETSPAILRIDVHGVIGLGDMTYDKFDNMLLDSRDGMLHDNRVKAIFLHMDTPGGTVTDADAIYRSLMTYKKKYNVPVYAFVDGLCASGGMYIASAADRVYATSASVVGSIGVIMGPSFNFSGAMTKYGIESLTLTEGKDKDMLNPFRPWVAGEDQSLKDIVADLYQRFVNIVTTARPMIDKTKLINEYGAQVFIASKGQEIGYIDVADANYSLAMKELAAAAGITEGQHYQVVKMQPPRAFFADLTQGKSPLTNGKITHSFQIGPHLNSELSGKFLYIFQPAQDIR